MKACWLIVAAQLHREIALHIAFGGSSAAEDMISFMASSRVLYDALQDDEGVWEAVFRTVFGDDKAPGRSFKQELYLRLAIKGTGIRLSLQYIMANYQPNEAIKYVPITSVFHAYIHICWGQVPDQWHPRGHLDQRRCPTPPTNRCSYGTHLDPDKSLFRTCRCYCPPDVHPQRSILRHENRRSYCLPLPWA